MELVRGWEKQYAPDVTGGLRLSKARTYRDIGEEEGLGDTQEGEMRARMQGQISRSSDWAASPPITVVLSSEQGEPDVEVEGLMSGETRKVLQHLRVEDSKLGSPFLYVMATSFFETKILDLGYAKRGIDPAGDTSGPSSHAHLQLQIPNQP